MILDFLLYIHIKKEIFVLLLKYYFDKSYLSIIYKAIFKSLLLKVLELKELKPFLKSSAL